MAPSENSFFRIDNKGKTKLDCYQVAKFIIEKYKIITPLKSGIPYIYENGFYNPYNSFRKIEAIIQKTINENCTQHAIKEILGHIIRKSYNDNNIQNEVYICTENGLINLSNASQNKIKFIQNHDSKKFITWKVNAIFDKNQSSKPIKDYIQSMVSKKDALKLQEHVGNIFSNHYLTKKLVFLIGPKNSGKSTFLQILQKFIGPENCSNLMLNELGDKFTSFAIHNKRANISPDIQYRLPVKHYGRIKSLTGGDTITLQKKGENPFSYTPIAKLFFSANGVPLITEKQADDAFYERWDFIKFEQSFDEKDDYLNKYTTPEMMSSFLRWTLEGYVRLVKNNWKITNAISLSEARDMFLEADHIVTDFDVWLTENYTISKDGYILREEAFNDCKEWHFKKKKLEHIYLSNFDIFCKKMYNNKYLSVEKYRPTVNGEQSIVFKGIKKRSKTTRFEDEEEEDCNIYLLEDEEN